MFLKITATVYPNVLKFKFAWPLLHRYKKCLTPGQNHGRKTNKNKFSNMEAELYGYIEYLWESVTNICINIDSSKRQGLLFVLI